MSLICNGGSTSLGENPCTGRCSTTWGDTICKGCGRTEQQIRDWAKIPEIERKLIVISCWTAGYTPRQKKEYLLDKLKNKKSHIDISPKKKLIL
jgi:predicted Fe-S protein YdhL (DUF1289 family)